LRETHRKTRLFVAGVRRARGRPESAGEGDSDTWQPPRITDTGSSCAPRTIAISALVMTAIPSRAPRRELIGRLRQIDERTALIVLLGSHIVICCISLALIAPHHFSFHIFYDPVQLPIAIAAVGAFAVAAWAFTAVPFSFGYLLSFYFYTVVLGYLWL